VKNIRKIRPEDFKNLFDSEVEQMERRYDGAFIYKYLCFADPQFVTEFFTRPTLKFTHKDDLNDPFELSRRWEDFGCPFNETMLEWHLRRPLRARLSDVLAARKEMAVKAKEQMPWLSRRERRKTISERIGRRELSKVRNETLVRASEIEAAMPTIFPALETGFIQDFAATTGILSLTENPVSSYMWDKYAANGYGFVLEYNAAHDFFVRKADDGTRRKVIRPVFYRDDRIADFWKNPYYLFLVKNTCWKIEEEWRVIRSIDECRKVVRAGSSDLYLVDIPRGLISSIIFGYNNSHEFMNEAASRLRRFDQDIKYRQARLSSGGEIGIHDL
jgi:hypothetical protein